MFICLDRAVNVNMKYNFRNIKYGYIEQLNTSIETRSLSSEPIPFHIYNKRDGQKCDKDNFFSKKQTSSLTLVNTVFLMLSHRM